MKARTRLAVDLGPRLGLVALCALAACGDAIKAPPPAASTAVPAPTYERELATVSAAIDERLQRLARQPDDAQAALATVSLYTERARLTGDYADYRSADALLEATTARMDPGAYPCLDRARLDFAVNRLAAASDALASCPGAVARDEIAGLHADIAFHTGHYRQAELIYRALVNRNGTPQQYVRLALLRGKTGAPGEAAALLEAAEARDHAATAKAWLRIQRGVLALERGRFDEARALYRAAGEALPGWWLVDEHVAEVERLAGDAARAAAAYQGAIERGASPSSMDALALVRAGEGRLDEAAQLRQRARAIHEARLAEFPEAAAGAALEHFLQGETEAGRALALAERSYEVSPHGDAAIALARALLRNGQARRAIDLLEAQLAAGWDTAEMHWVLGEALAQIGQRDGAKAAEQAALARNRESEAMYASVAR